MVDAQRARLRRATRGIAVVSIAAMRGHGAGGAGYVLAAFLVAALSGITTG